MMFLAITLVVFVVLHAKGYYAFGIYPIFFAFGAVFFENIINNKVLRYATVLLPFLLFRLTVVLRLVYGHGLSIQ